jgi:hypothetical protein
MVRLRVKERAGDMKLSALQYQLTLRLGEQVYPATVRRYWYGTADGRPEGEPIKMIDLRFVEAIADVLGVPLCDLLEQSVGEELGNWEPALIAA